VAPEAATPQPPGLLLALVDSLEPYDGNKAAALEQHRSRFHRIGSSLARALTRVRSATAGAGAIMIIIIIIRGRPFFATRRRRRRTKRGRAAGRRTRRTTGTRWPGTLETCWLAAPPRWCRSSTPGPGRPKGRPGAGTGSPETPQHRYVAAAATASSLHVFAFSTTAYRCRAPVRSAVRSVPGRWWECCWAGFGRTSCCGGGLGEPASRGGGPDDRRSGDGHVIPNPCFSSHGRWHMLRLLDQGTKKKTVGDKFKEEGRGVWPPPPQPIHRRFSWSCTR
jgi:hypothetical protein